MLWLTTPAPVKLLANSLNEIVISIRPGAYQIGTMGDALLNVVDVDTKTVLSSWMVIVHSVFPPITKVFEIKIPKGKSSNKVNQLCAVSLITTESVLHEPIPSAKAIDTFNKCSSIAAI